MDASSTAWERCTTELFSFWRMWRLRRFPMPNGLYCTNAQTSISFVRSGRVGPLRGEARVLRSGKLLSTYEVRVTDAEGGLVAVATITGYGVGARLPLGDA